MIGKVFLRNLLGVEYEACLYTSGELIDEPQDAFSMRICKSIKIIARAAITTLCTYIK